MGHDCFWLARFRNKGLICIWPWPSISQFGWRFSFTFRFFWYLISNRVRPVELSCHHHSIQDHVIYLALVWCFCFMSSGVDSHTTNWCKDILTSIMQNTPIGWPSHTLQYFPQSLVEFFTQNPVNKEDKTLLKRNVEAEYKKWKSGETVFKACL